MTTEPVRAGQVWRYRDEREDRQVVVDGGDDGRWDVNPILLVHNERTGRRSRIRESVLRKTYRLLPASRVSTPEET